MTYDEIPKYTGPTNETRTMFRLLREQFDPSHVLLKASVRCRSSPDPLARG